jgi:hypothetical protein
MDFKSLRGGNPIYIIYRGEKPELKIAEVTGYTEPHCPLQNQLAALGSNLKQVVDITAKDGEKVIPLNNLPADASSETYNNGAQFVTPSQVIALQEVDRMMAESRQALSRVDYHNSVLVEGEKMLETLNPKYAEEKAQKADIATLKEQVNGFADKFDQMMQMMNDIQASLKSAKK